MKKVLAALIVTLFALSASAEIGPKNAYAPSKMWSNGAYDISGVATPNVDIQNAHASGVWGLLLVYVRVVDADNSVTAIGMSCTGSDDNNTLDFVLQECTVAAGVATCVDLSWTKNPGAGTTYWVWRVDIEGLEDMQCTFSDVGGGANDTLTVWTALAVK